MNHRERKARWKAITQLRERDQLSLDDQLERFRTAHQLPVNPWDAERDNEDEPAAE